ncbi:MAG: 50S ribosomal protein L5 [Candidatus Omnitrophica bacterium]|jgi:large subunit ribosomal protein L5|nr:50S ribosomal protein L5 [Candidatus Omnitrophota bacterium]
MATTAVPRLLKKYGQEVIPAVQKKFGIKNPMAVPRLEKIVINMGVGAAIADLKILDAAVADLATITGQKPIIRRARIAISNFKLREGLPIGCMVTLRRYRMYEFLDRFVSVALPRIRDFNGVPTKSFDKQGNYNLGITEQTIFAEIEVGRLSRTQGMDIAFVFSHGKTEENFEVLRLLGMPFRKPRGEEGSN